MWPPRQVCSHCCCAPSNWKTIKPTLTIYFSFCFFFDFISSSSYFHLFAVIFLMRSSTSFLLRLQIFKAALSRRERRKWLTFYFFLLLLYGTKVSSKFNSDFAFLSPSSFLYLLPEKTKHFNVSILIKAKNEARWRAEYEVMLVIKILLLIFTRPDVFNSRNCALRKATTTTESKLPKMISYRLHERLMKTLDRFQRSLLSWCAHPRDWIICAVFGTYDLHLLACKMGEHG